MARSAAFPLRRLRDENVARRLDLVAAPGQKSVQLFWSRHRGHPKACRQAAPGIAALRLPDRFLQLGAIVPCDRLDRVDAPGEPITECQAPTVQGLDEACRPRPHRQTLDRSSDL
jgi:hypothetical protein